MPKLYDLGQLETDVSKLYDMCVTFDRFYSCLIPSDNAEIWQVLHAVSESLWSRLPAVVTIDLRDPDAVDLMLSDGPQ